MGKSKEEIRPTTNGMELQKISYWLKRDGADFKEKRTLNECRVLHHLERYWFVNDYWKMNIKKKVKILDAGCGECVGTMELLQGIPNVDYILGIEIDQDVIDRSNDSMVRMDIHKENVETMLLKDSFDIVVCYELLGNESIKSDAALIRNLYDHLEANGYLFISIPNYKEADNPKWYFDRVYDNKKFTDGILTCLKDYNFSCNFFHQMHPMNRKSEEQIGIHFGQDENADFLIAVIRKMK